MNLLEKLKIIKASSAVSVLNVIESYKNYQDESLWPQPNVADRGEDAAREADGDDDGNDYNANDDALATERESRCDDNERRY